MPASDTQPSVRARLSGALKRGRRSAVGELLIIVVLAAGLAFGVQALLVKPFRIPSRSMEPTLVPEQKILVNRLSYRLGSPQIGDVAVFTPPIGAERESQCAVEKGVRQACPSGGDEPADQSFVKRIVAGPGDRLSIENGHPVLNGELVVDEPFIEPCGNAQGCDLPREITIPADHFFMMGDNRGDSDDSRFWGPVPEDWIIGKAFFTYWPLKEIGGI